jgi:hypothetical protein
MSDTGKTTKKFMINSNFTNQKEDFIRFNTGQNLSRGPVNHSQSASYRLPQGILKSVNSASVLVKNQLKANHLKTSASHAPGNGKSFGTVNNSTYSRKTKAPTKNVYGKKSTRKSRNSRKSRRGKRNSSPDNLSLYSNNVSVFIDPNNVPKPAKGSGEVRRLNLKAILNIQKRAKLWLKKIGFDKDDYN